MQTLSYTAANFMPTYLRHFKKILVDIYLTIELTLF